jgi:hypothetical protein
MARKPNFPEDKMEQLIARLVRLWQDPQDYPAIAMAVQTLDTHYDLYKKLVREPGVAEIIEQMAGRLAQCFNSLSDHNGKRILDIACGSNTSKMPGSIYVNTPFGEITLGSRQGYTSLFEPWFCRMLFQLGANPVGVDFGDLEQEVFEHHHVDLGKPRALSFLTRHSFYAIQDCRLFGSPEFTAQFPEQRDRLKVAHEIVRQEKRLLMKAGIIIHSDAMELIK